MSAPAAVRVVFDWVLRLAKFAFAMGLVFGVAWVMVLEDRTDNAERDEALEVKLKDEYRDKKVQAVNLPGVRQQLRELEAAMAAQASTLPTRFEQPFVSTLKIAQASGLRVERLKADGQGALRETHAELQSSLAVAGSFRQLVAFANAVAADRAPTALQDLRIESQGPAGPLSMEASAKLYRYLDDEEVAAARKARAARKGPAKK